MNDHGSRSTTGSSRSGGFPLTTSYDDTTPAIAPSRSARLRGQRLSRFIPFIGYLLAQSFIVAGLVTPAYPDSAAYTELSFTGHDPRLWTVPLLYKIFTTDPLRVAVQVVIAAFCWWFLARQASELVRNPRVRLGLRIVILMLGLVGPISSWNSTILSDSLAVSLTALLIACWLRHRATPSWKSAVAIVVVTLFWTFTRNDLVVIGVGVTVLVVISVVWRHRNLLNIGLVVGLVAINAYGLSIDGNNPYVANANIADVIEQRILPNTDWTNWFVSHGMPFSSAIAATENGIYGEGLMAIPSFNSWLTTNGTSTYAQFIVSHPVYTFWYTLPYFSGEEASLNWPNKTPYPYVQPNPTPSMVSPDANYGRHRDILPTVIEELLFQQGQIGDIMLLAFCTFGLAYVARRKLGKDDRMWIPLIVTVSAIPQGYLVWLFGGNAEVDRHALILAVSLRIGLWIAAGYALDRVIEARLLRLPKTTT